MPPSLPARKRSRPLMLRTTDAVIAQIEQIKDASLIRPNTTAVIETAIGMLLKRVQEGK